MPRRSIKSHLARLTRRISVIFSSTLTCFSSCLRRRSRTAHRIRRLCDSTDALTGFAMTMTPDGLFAGYETSPLPPLRRRGERTGKAFCFVPLPFLGLAVRVRGQGRGSKKDKGTPAKRIASPKNAFVLMP